MITLRKSIFINAAPEKVWRTMLDKPTYEQWTKPFNPTSTFEGSWDEGSDIRFVGVDESTGESGGMLSRIKENRPFEFVSIEHLGILHNGVEDYTSDEVKKWAHALENYTLTPKDSGTELLIEVQIADDQQAEFEKMWDEALTVLKTMSEA